MAARGRRRHPAVAALLTVTLLLLTGCSSGAADPKPPRPPADGGDQRYGVAPASDPEVTYQPDVVFVGGGGGSVRGLSEDALTWRIDPGASGADKLARGKVMFLTGRAVGRVLDVRSDGDDLAVTLGPVDITQVIRDGTFASDGPVSLESPTRYDGGTPFWAEYDAEAGGAGGGGGAGGAGFAVTPICCARGVGAHFTYDGGGIRISGTATLLMKKPTARFHLEIRGATVQRAELEISGVAGLRIEIAGATDRGHNINKRIPIPLDFSVPVDQILGVPFAVTASQLIGVQTAFSAKDGNIKAAGEWSLGGSLGFGYANGAFGATEPWSLTLRNSITDSITGPSVGVNGIIVHYQAAFRAGLGALGFTAGLYATVTTSVGLTVGSALGSPITVCRSTQLGLYLDYGVGYSIPAGLVKVINAFLDLVNVAPIGAKAGIGGSDVLFSKLDLQPNTRICRS
ncbi:hypothetical protein EV382_2135 [Micromonospora violae]|uniref:DUF5666 domain-containing protein n=1 Tax=Micromonospora violae TaxID=1278207 RepID=A0A4Q7UHA1_9ACTN|nr:hypothetical protein [Micromonospora violae]RZT78939.1 hypothetical protein EV382_2135 [Micromonospora violae]